MLRAVALVGLVVTVGCATSPIGRARAILDDDGRFGTATEASQSFGAIGDVLIQVADECPPDVNCEALRSATAYAVVLGAQVATCTAPGRHDAREKLGAFLDAIEDIGPDDRVPDSPGLLDCR